MNRTWSLKRQLFGVGFGLLVTAGAMGCDPSVTIGSGGCGDGGVNSAHSGTCEGAPFGPYALSIKTSCAPDAGTAMKGLLTFGGTIPDGGAGTSLEFSPNQYGCSTVWNGCTALVQCDSRASGLTTFELAYSAATNAFTGTANGYCVSAAK